MNKANKTLVLHVTGMTCGGCEVAIMRVVSKLEGIESVEASHTTESVVVVYRPGSANPTMIKSAIDALGYSARLQ